MGVLGLWQILESVGHPIKIEGLEGKRLGVDANVWLYKFIRGFREKDNATTSIDSHKLGLFNRISKLLFYKIKPVFVFDGPAPVLKRRTLERRQNVRNKQLEKVQAAAMKLFNDQIKSLYPNANIDQINFKLPELRSNNLVAAEKLGDEDRELFLLPPELIHVGSEEDEFDQGEEFKLSSQVKREDIVYHVDSDDELGANLPKLQGHIDINSKEFQNLPAEIRYEYLQDLKESKRRIRRADNLPEDAETFSSFQMDRLKARRSIQAKIEQCEKDICSTYTGDCDGKTVQSYRVQSDSSSTMLYMKNASSQEVSPSSAMESLQGIVQSKSDQEKEFRLSSQVKRDDIVNHVDSDDELGTGIVESKSDQEEESRLSSQVKREDIVYHVDSDDELGTGIVQSKFNQEVEFKEPSQAKREDTIYLLDSDDELSTDSPKLQGHIDINSKEFEDSPAEIRYEYSKESKRADNSPEDAETFSSFQMDRLKARRSIQAEIEQCDEDICSSMTSAGNFPDSNNKRMSPCLPEPLTSIEPTKSSERAEPIMMQTSSRELRDAKAASNRVTTKIVEDSPAEIEEYEKDICPSMTSASNFPDSSDKRMSPCPPEPLPSTESTKSSERVEPIMMQTSSRELRDAKATTNRVTTKIVEDAKELLRLFGIPYIDASGEAEAQCALLEKLKLTEGTITDDSDVWLFGAQNVFRYFFSDDKYVMQYKMTDIEYHIRMTRDHLVCFAMLVGSDYTDGIMNVGPVTALEILSEFPGEEMEPLIKFKNWKQKYETSKGRVPGSKKREKLLKFRLPDEFPSRAVFEGYTRPIADTSTEEFKWGIPELDELREYARRNFGWDPKKIDEKLLPVMKRLNEKKTQMTIDTFFFKTAANQNPELFRSKRINQALTKIAKTSSSQEDVVVLTESEDDESDVEQQQQTKSRRTQKNKSDSKRADQADAEKKSRPKRGETTARRRRKVRGR